MPYRARALLVSTMLTIACAGPAGRLSYTDVDSAAMNEQLRYGVYLPPGWDRSEPLPLVVLLHGAGDDETTADRRVVIEALDQAIAAGEVPPFVMVTPEGRRGFWVNWYDGSARWRDWVIDEVIPDIRRNHPLVEGPEGLHLMGVSMGGGGGMQVWLEDPSRFASATILSAPILDEADTRAFLRRFMPAHALERVFGPPGSSFGIDPYVALDDHDALGGSRLLFGAARNDRGGIKTSNRAFHQHLEERNVPHGFVEFSGGHGWKTWARVFPFALCVQLDPDCKMTAPAAWTVHLAK